MLNQKIELNFDNFLEQIPDDHTVVRNAMWDITVLLKKFKSMREALPKVNKNPNDSETFQPYLEGSFGVSRGFRILIHSDDVPLKSKENLKKMDKLYDAYDKIVSAILDGNKRHDEAKDKGVLILDTIISNLDKVWDEVVAHHGIEDQLRAFGDRDITPYVKHIIGYQPGLFGDSPDKVVGYFIKKECDALANEITEALIKEES